MDMKVHPGYLFEEPYGRPLPKKKKLLVDCFAGGGGASTGIRNALGEDVHIVVNHDRSAISMHQVNHRGSLRHYCEDIWHVPPRIATEGRRVLMAWFSPDCRHFSKAKGGTPVKKNIRGLAWSAIIWAEEVRPDVIFLENVDEFRTWGPVDRKTNQPIKEKAGITFELFNWKLRQLGYKVEWRKLVAHEYGSPTSRERLFMVARCDGKPIKWPVKTHGSPKEIEREMAENGYTKLKKWRTAADIIDWSIPCPSIFETKDEIWDKHRVKVKRPLVEKTMNRIAEGIRRFVIETDDPYIVGGDGESLSPFIGSVAHGGDHARVHHMQEPTRTLTGKNDKALVTPFLSRYYGQSVGSSIGSPVGSLTQENNTAVVTPFMAALQHGGMTRDIRRPLHTVTASKKDCNLVVAPSLVQVGYGERKGQRPRCLDIHKPLGTVVGTNKHALVSAFVAKHFGGMVGTEITNPFPTITARGTQNQIVTSHLMKLKGTCRHGQRVDQPMPTVQAGGLHVSEVRAFMFKYYGNGGWNSIREPLATITVKERLALGIVMIRGQAWQIYDIGMRMLTPRELFDAQGFPPDYKIDQGYDGRPLSKTAQVARCGNSVSPHPAEALVKANLN